MKALVVCAKIYLPFVVFLLVAAACSGSNAVAPDAKIQADDARVPLETFSVEFKTSAGTFIVDVTRAWSPRGADRFRELVEAGFYDGCRFFRVLPGFVAQFGINGTPAVQAQWDDKEILDDPVIESNVRATLTFATAGPNTRTTQLFINFGDNSRLDQLGFSPFGVVRSGMEAVDAINDEYREEPDQDRITAEGNAYLETNYPNLDFIESARIL
jgi:cyclophilin family peptidyl-prolyl cis-trans isomerase